MRILIAEDDLTSRKFMYKLLSDYGQCDLVVDGLEAVEAYILALKEENPYQLICMDVMMPKVDGVRALQAIRHFENQKGIIQEKKAKIVMTTVLAESNFVQSAFEYGCDAYAAKPINTTKFLEVIHKLGLHIN
jgi:two-component system chemotaxis response regulator CheY